MQVNVPPDIENLIKERLSTGDYTDAEDVIRHALESQDERDSWTDGNSLALATHIEEGYLQAELSELIDEAQLKREVHEMKEEWRSSRR